MPQNSRHSSRANLDYLVYLPEKYHLADVSTRYPLILFLHGAGERGSTEKVRQVGLPKKLESEANFPFIVISPACPAESWWNFHLDQLIALLDDALNSFMVNPKQVYLTGLSMGGYGSWMLAMQHPERFAAVAPICGWMTGDIAHVATIKATPIWAFHGAKDDVVRIETTQMIVDELKRLGANPKFTIFPEANHNSWDAAYGTADLYTWFLQHELAHPIYETPAKPQSVLSAANIDFLTGECDRLLTLYTEAQSNAQSVFNFYLTFLTTVVGGVIVIIQTSTNPIRSQVIISALLFFAAIVGSVYLVSIAFRNARAARYAYAVDAIRRYLAQAGQFQLPPIYIPFFRARDFDPAPPISTRRKFIAGIMRFIPSGTFHIFIAIMNSLALAVGTWLVASTFQADSTVSLLATIGVFFVVLLVYNIYAALIVERISQGITVVTQPSPFK